MSVEKPIARPWSVGDLKALERCATAVLPALVIALKLGRGVLAVQGKRPSSAYRRSETGQRIVDRIRLSSGSSGWVSASVRRYG
ncbi:hypothetical protein JOF29_003142 [Kribbella aluminosa]|uniref:Uncharacterized protein n=1 Tax=Kribbella aluminosa TaxID=416017 RepID=A0ABS4UKK2_9ACTN|nr:hypothetical protein [Kribbella aluminosa]